MADEVFRNDGYAFVFEAGVVSVNGDEVVLDCTAFYPGGGGQVCDTGKIQGFRVTEVHYRGKEIVHVVPGNDLKQGMRVWGEVDWDRRYDLMKGHTGEHLLFCALHRQDPDLAITKIFISPDEKYVIVNHDISWDKIGTALEFANKAIRDNLSVRKAVMSRDDPDLSKVRIKLDRIDKDAEITVVSIGNIDYSACSGIHVAETSELGMLFVDRKVSAGKDGVAIHFKIGNEAEDAARRLAVICMQTIEAANSKPEDIVRTVTNMKHDLALAAETQKAAVRERLSTLLPKDVGGTMLYSSLFTGADRKLLSDAAEKIKSKGGVAIFVSVSDKASVIIASGSHDLDCRKLLSETLDEFGGHGGGKKDFAQGGSPDTEKAEVIFNDLLRRTEKALSH